MFGAPQKERFLVFIRWPFQTAQVAATKAINITLTFLYRNGLWIRDTDARKLSDWIFSFLGHYSVLADLSVRRGKSRFPMYPKNHMVCHDALEIRKKAETCEWQLSPLATSCQQQEDFIGKPSKLSRSTNIRQAHRSVIWRSMIKIRFCLLDSGKDQRGMDAYMGWKGFKFDVKNLMSILKVLLFWPPFWFNLISGSQTPKDWENALAGSMQNRLRSSYSSGAREKWKGCESWGVRTWALCMFIFLVKIKRLRFE